MPNYEITVSVHVPDELHELLNPSNVFSGVLEKHGDCVSHCKPAATNYAPPDATPGTPVEISEPKTLAKPGGKVTIDDAKMAVRKWAETNGGPAKAKDALATHFGVKLSEIDESQVEAVYLHFTGAA